MKTCITYLILFIAIIQVNCKARQNKNFILTTKQSEIILKSISNPHIAFKLQSGDTIRFGKQDFVDIIDQFIKSEIEKMGYSSSPNLSALSENLKNVSIDTTVYQNLSAIDIKTISGNLDSWIANRLLLKGKAIISLMDQKQNPQKLKYVYTKDILGGEQAIFYFENKKIYSAVISWGE